MTELKVKKVTASEVSKLEDKYPDCSDWPKNFSAFKFCFDRQNSNVVWLVKKIFKKILKMKFLWNFKQF